MAKLYVPVLGALKQDFIALGRDKNKATAFSEETGARVVTSSLEEAISEHNITHAIVVVPVLALDEVTQELIKLGIKNILVEKPGAKNIAGLKKLSAECAKYDVNINVAYNRRFLASVLKAKEYIAEDGGARLVTFNFTEMSERITYLNYPKELTENWFFCNSTHVADTAVFLGGCPTQVDVLKTGSLNWHSKGATFAGSARTDDNTLFSFQADWAGSGRWSLEVSTSKRRLILCPLEELHIQISGQFGIIDDDIDYTFDKNFKPGLYRMVEAFYGMGLHTQDLCTLGSHIRNCQLFYEKICQTT